MLRDKKYPRDRGEADKVQNVQSGSVVSVSSFLETGYNNGIKQDLDTEARNIR